MTTSTSTRVASIVVRPLDDLPEARVWRPELMAADEPPGPGMPIQPALFPIPPRMSSRRRSFVDLLDAARLVADEPTGPGGRRGPSGRPGPGGVRVVLVGAAPAPALPDVRRWSVNLGVALVEVLLGQRPLAQLLRWLSDRVLGRLGVAASARRDRLGDGPRERISVVSVRVQVLDPRTVEVCLHATRTRDRFVVAFRLVATGERWLCTELDLLTPGR